MMKNSEIHTGLDKKEHRDFISSGLRVCSGKDCTLKKKTIPFDKDNLLEWAINDSRSEIEYHQEKIKNTKDKIALFGIMDMLSWEEFDVSDETIKDDDAMFSLNFVGTEEEYDNFIKNIVQNKEE